MEKYSGVAQDNAGNALANPTVTVTYAGTPALASIFSTNTYTVLANPFAGNADGTYDFYAGDGHYDITIAKTGFIFTPAITTDITLRDPFSTITPPALTINTNDYNPTNGPQANIWRISSTGAVNVTGIGSSGLSGQTQWLTLINIGTQNISITNQDGLSTAGFRIITGTGGTIVLGADATMTLVYDPLTIRWRKVV